MGDDTDIDLYDVSILDDDSIPNNNQSLTCFSCDAPMSGLYCAACGNKNDNYRRSIWSLGVELFSSLTAIEGRIWRSLRSLVFSPGKMAREFADGARQKWTSPVRLYLAMSIILFGYIGISKTQIIAFGAKAEITQNSEDNSEKLDYTPEVFFLEKQSTLRSKSSAEALAALEGDVRRLSTDNTKKTMTELKVENAELQAEIEVLNQQLETQTVEGPKRTLLGKKYGLIARQADIQKEIKIREVAETQGSQGEDSAILQDFGSESDTTKKEANPNFSFTTRPGQKYTIDNDGIGSALLTILRKPERINAPMNKYLPRIMFLMMPLSMLVGAIFIRSRDRAMLYDHLVHAAYIHAFSFLLLFLFVILVQYTPLNHLLWAYIPILLIYLPLSAKGMFGRGWFKTILASYCVGLVYTFIMGFILIGLIGWGAFQVAAEYSQSTAS